MNTKAKPESSLGKRYSFKVLANLVGFGVGIFTQSIIPRALGPAQYGNYSFLTNFFQQAIGFLNLNSSTAFYTKLCQRQDDKGLISFYFYITLIMAMLTGMFVMFCYVTGIDYFVWPQQMTAFIVMAAILAFLQLSNGTLIQVSDAFGLTTKSEPANMATKLIGLAIILWLFLRENLTLLNYFLLQIFLVVMSGIFLVILVQKYRNIFMEGWRVRNSQYVSYLREFIIFCSPLVLFSGLSILEGILDRWYLQKFSGSVEQGFYGLAYQIGAICFLFVSAMIPLITREYAIAFSERNSGELRRLFLRFAPLMYFVAAYFSCFLSVESKNVILILAGREYSYALLPIMIMCFYPIHQTYGQLNASFLFATDRTRMYRNIGIFFVLLGLPASVVLLGPSHYGALQMGATGLALKMVIVQFLSVNVQLWFILKYLDLSFKKYLVQQLAVIVTFVFFAILSSYISRITIHKAHYIVQFVTSGAVYSLCVACLALIVPGWLGLRKGELISLGRRLKIT